MSTRRSPKESIISQERSTLSASRGLQQVGAPTATTAAKAASGALSKDKCLVLDLEQGSDRWLKHRARAIGASEVSSLLGLNPWQSAKELYDFKTGRKKRPKPNARMLRGTKLEPHIRNTFELAYGVSLRDTQYSLALREADFITASLDGMIHEIDCVVEFKAPNQKVIEAALSGQVVDYYYCQLQHQMLVSGAEYAAFVCFDGRWITEPVVVSADGRYQEIIYQRCETFMELVRANAPLTQIACDQLFAEVDPYLLSRAAKLFYVPWTRLLKKLARGTQDV